MSAFSSADREYMARALRLARRGLYTAHPNPRVGCVLVRSGEIVGEGWHRKTGEAHAEIEALTAAGDAAKGSAAYVTLEPCSHRGKTPPCANALVEAGVASVKIAMRDPNPKVAGAGLKVLLGAGMEVDVGLLQKEALTLNEGFVSRHKRGRPFVRLKIATSLDGATAMSSGESHWITGEASRRDVQRLRASSGAIMTGVGTAVADDPSLTIRDETIDNDDMQPARIVIDSELRLPPSAGMLRQPGDTIVFCLDDSKRQALEGAGATVIVVPDSGGRPDLSAVLQRLAEIEVNDVLVEAGPELAGSLVTARLVDELVIYQAPHIMGSETLGMVATPAWQALHQRLDLEIVDIRKTGVDMRITARPTGC